MKNRNHPRGTTFIELLFYIGIFLVLTPILLTVAINSLNTSRQYTIEREVNSDSQFAAERIYDLIAESKKVNLSDSTLNNENGRLSLIMQDDSSVIIELNSKMQAIEITEGGITANLTSTKNRFEQLYFEKIEDDVNDPEIALGINIRIKSAGKELTSIEQDYTLSGNLERGDYDGDGCPDHIDLFPRHAECCGDGDSDGMCDELDNCISEYNPFQEDYDQDSVGDACDISAFVEGGNSDNTSTLGAFNCNADDDLLDLIYADPPTPSSTLKSILLSSSPLSPTVLWALEDTHPLMSNGHFKQVILENFGLPVEIYNAIMLLDIPSGHADQFEEEQEDEDEIAYYEENHPIINYQLTFYSDAPEEENWTNRIKFHTPDYPLCGDDDEHDDDDHHDDDDDDGDHDDDDHDDDDGDGDDNHDSDDINLNKTDIFVLDVQNGSDSVSVTTETSSGTETTYLTTSSNYVVNSQGFAIEFNEKVGNAYAILITSESCSDQLDSVEIDFETNADILSPLTAATDYDAVRYTSYCAGGCSTGCGDVGTGVATSNLLSSLCYKADTSLPEWCSHWYTFEDNDTDNPAFIGGTQEGIETAYWETTFKSVINELQLENLESITVTGEIAFQNITQFFCDTLVSSCPMEGILNGAQDIELYDFSTESWISIGTTNADDSISDQQTFEIVYNGADVGDFIGGIGNEQIKARIEFSWDGEPSQGTSAPSFMLIDYFTVHLKW